MVEEERGGEGGEKWWRRREAVEEKIGGGGGERRCTGMGGEPTDSDTEGTADSIEAEGGEAAKEEPMPTGCCRWHWRCRSLPLAAADAMGLTSDCECQTG